MNRPDPYPTMDHEMAGARRIGGSFELGPGCLAEHPNLKSEQRSRIFSQLMEKENNRGRVEGMKDRLYACLRRELLKAVENQKFKARCEFLAPLDNMLWDRSSLPSGFDYKWEIYTPVHQRRYGHYVLPVLYGRPFCGGGLKPSATGRRRPIVKNFCMKKA